MQEGNNCYQQHAELKQLCICNHSVTSLPQGVTESPKRQFLILIYSKRGAFISASFAAPPLQTQTRPAHEVPGGLRLPCVLGGYTYGGSLKVMLGQSLRIDQNEDDLCIAVGLAHDGEGHRCTCVDHVRACDVSSNIPKHLITANRHDYGVR